MNSELKEFLSTLLPNLVGEPDKKVFLRNKVPAEVKTFASYLYLNGPSYRQVKRLLGDLGVKVAHSAVWYWLQQVGEIAKNMKVEEKERKRLVVDETKIKVQGGWIWIFAAIDPENREIVNILVTRYRESMDALIFLKQCLKYCEDKPTLITDGGPWYRWPAQRLGLEHVVLSGGVRSYIERWFETLKDRLRAFDCYFPTGKLESVENFCEAFRFFYNQCRYHQSMKGPPTGGIGGLKTWMEALI